MEITKEWLAEKSACRDGVSWFTKQEETDGIKLVEKLIDINIDWANWLVTQLMNKPQRVQYAVFAAEKVIHIFEKKYPADKRPRNAIEAAKAWLKDQSEENKKSAAYAAYAASAAAYAASAAAYAAYAAYAAASAAAASAAYDAAAYAAYAAASAAAYAAASAAAASAAYDAAAYAAEAAYAARKKTKEEIIRYGLKILKSALVAKG